MVTKGEILENMTKLQDMNDYIRILINLHQTALFNWNIDGVTHSLPQKDIDELIARYQTLKAQLATKYEGLL